jgi:hypothetical protein
VWRHLSQAVTVHLLQHLNGIDQVSRDGSWLEMKRLDIAIIEQPSCG